MENTPKSVLIAEDHSITRKGLSILLKDINPDILIYEASSIRQLNDQLKKTPKLDLVLLDLYFYNEPILPYLPNIRKLYPKLKFLVITAAEVNMMAVRILELGIKGIINKSSSYESMRSAIIKTMNDDYAIPSDVMSDLISQSSGNTVKIKKQLVKSLTKRELEVLSFLLKGYKIKDIATQLNITEPVVSIHKRNLFKKLKVDSIQELMHWANTNNFPMHI